MVAVAVTVVGVASGGCGCASEAASETSKQR